MPLASIRLLFLLICWLICVPGSWAGGVDRETVTIWSEGVRLQGDLYKPRGLAKDTRLPGILLVQGWGGTKDRMRETYAPRFAELGFIVLAFDFKGWGESNGPLLMTEALPQTLESEEVSVRARHIRLVVDPISMTEDARAALHFLAGEPQVQADNIGIWGTSLGGGMALVAAVGDARVKALVDQIGSVNYGANLAMISKAMATGWETHRARGNTSAYPGPESKNPAFRGYPDYVRMKRYDPADHWDDLAIPTLIIDAEDEELFDRKDNGQALYESIKDRVDARYLVLPGKHYDVYRDEGYRRALKAAQDWFVVHLKPDAALNPP